MRRNTLAWLLVGLGVALFALVGLMMLLQGVQTSG